MNTGDARRLLLVAWLALVGVTIAREVQAGFVPPRPGAFIGGAVAYTVLGGIGEVAPTPAFLLAGLFDIAVLLTPFLKDPKNSPVASVFNWIENSGLFGGNKK